MVSATQKYHACVCCFYLWRKNCCFRLQRRVKRRSWCPVLQGHSPRRSRWRLASTVPSLSTQMEPLVHVVKEAMGVWVWETPTTSRSLSVWSLMALLRRCLHRKAVMVIHWHFQMMARFTAGEMVIIMHLWILCGEINNFSGCGFNTNIFVWIHNFHDFISVFRSPSVRYFITDIRHATNSYK